MVWTRICSAAAPASYEQSLWRNPTAGSLRVTPHVPRD